MRKSQLLSHEFLSLQFSHFTLKASNLKPIEKKIKNNNNNSNNKYEQEHLVTGCRRTY